MLPCNVVVMEKDDGKISISAIDSLASMMAVDHSALKEVAAEIRAKLQKVIGAV